MIRIRSLIGEHFGQIGADQHDRHSLPGKLVDQLMDFHLGPDIDAAGRFVENQHFRMRFQPLADDHFLLIPTGKGGGGHIDRCRPDRRATCDRSRQPALPHSRLTMPSRLRKRGSEGRMMLLAIDWGSTRPSW